MKDGSLVYPHKGNPPPLLPGYDRDPGNPFRLVMGFDPCFRRSIKMLYNKKCGCGVESAVCTLHNELPVNAYFCGKCPYRAELPVLSAPTMTLQEMKQIPEVLVLAGKGPSLDRVDWSKLPEFRVAVNEAAYVVPNCTIATGQDSLVLQKYYSNLPPVKYFLLSRGSSAFRFHNALFYEDTSSYGSAAEALKALAEMGARKVHLVGFDGVRTHKWEYAPSLELANPPVYSYAKHREDLLNVIEEFELTVEWELGNA